MRQIILDSSNYGEWPSQFCLDGGSFNGIGVTVNGDFSYRNDDVLGEIDNVRFTFGVDEEVIHR